MAFQEYLEDVGRPPSRYIKIVPICDSSVVASTGWTQTASPIDRTPDQFSEFCKGLQRRYARPKKREPESSSPMVIRVRRKKKRSLSRDKDVKAALKRLILHYCVQLREQTKRRLNMDRRCNTMAMPGDLYMVDLRRASGYIGIYCRRLHRVESGKDAAVSSLVPLYRTLTVNLSVPIDIRQVQKELGPAASSMVIEPTRKGSFITTFRSVGKDELTIIAELIGRFDQQGILGLPLR